MNTDPQSRLNCPAVVLYAAKATEAAATWPQGLSAAEQQTLEDYARRLIGFYSFLSALGYSGANWVLSRHQLHHVCFVCEHPVGAVEYPYCLSGRGVSP